MTDSDPRLDDLLSAHLDGETTADEAARIERDPAAIARLEQLAAARDALSSDRPSVDAASRDTTLARVFAELDRDESPRPLTPVSDLSTRRRNPGRFLAAAAAAIIAVALLGGAIGMLANESGDDDSASSSGAEMSTMDDSTAADATGGSPERSAAAVEGASEPSLGRFDDTTQLRDAVRRQLLDPQSSSDLTSSEPDAEAPSTAAAAQALPPTCATPPGTQAVYRAEVAQRLLFVVVTGEPVALVIDPGTCTEVLRITQQ